MKKPFVFIAAAAMLAGCAAQPSSTVSGSEPAATPAPMSDAAAEDPGNGPVRLLSNVYEGGQYYRLNNCLYQIDYASGTAYSMCHVPGCSHATDSCPIYNTNVLLPDGDTLWQPYSYSTETNLYSALAVYADGTAPTVPVLIAADYDSYFAFYKDTLACDDRFFYYVAMSNGTQSYDSVLIAADRSTGETKVLTQLSTVLPETAYWELAGADGQMLYFCYSYYYSSDDYGVSCYNTVTGDYTLLPQYTVSEATFSRGQQYVSDTVQGCITVIDLATGQTVLTISGLPTGDEYGYSADRLSDGWLVGVTDFDSTFRRFYCAPDGTVTEITQKMYCDARGTETVQVLDIQNGLVFLQYDYRTTWESGFDYDGNPITYENYESVFGTIPLDDFLAGSQNYTELCYK